MAGITVKEKQYLLSSGADFSIYKHSDWAYDFADIVYRATIDRLETSDAPLTFETFFEEIVMPKFYIRCRDSIEEDMANESDMYVIKEAIETASLSDEFNFDEEETTIESREEAIDTLAYILTLEENAMIYRESKSFLDAVGIYVIDNEENEFGDDAFNDPINVLFHSEDQLYVHHIYYADEPRRIRFNNFGNKSLYSEYDRFVGKLDSKGFVSLLRTP